MDKRSLILSALLVAVAIGAMLVSSPRQSAPQPSNRGASVGNSGGATVEITAEGYAPTELTIRAGTVVTWVNRDALGHWPASDFHPTHTLYPEFDSREPIEPGRSWSFRFEQQGTWRWHDHLFSHLRGRIVVE